MEHLQRRQQCKDQLAEREQLRRTLARIENQLSAAREAFNNLEQNSDPIVAGKRRWWRGRNNDQRLVALANSHTTIIELEEDKAHTQLALEKLAGADDDLKAAEAACLAEWRMFDPERAKEVDEIDDDIANMTGQLLRLRESREAARDTKQHTGWLVGALQDAVTGITLAIAFHPDGSPTDGGEKMAAIEDRRQAVAHSGARIGDITVRTLACSIRPIAGPDGASSIARITDAYDSTRVLHGAVDAYLTALETELDWVAEQLDGCHEQREKLFSVS